MKTVELDLKGCQYMDEIHERIRLAFDFPEWYGKNWSACWDMISEPREDTVVYVHGIRTLPNDLQASGEKFISLLQRNKEKWEAFQVMHTDSHYYFDYKIFD